MYVSSANASWSVSLSSNALLKDSEVHKEQASQLLPASLEQSLRTSWLVIGEGKEDKCMCGDCRLSEGGFFSDVHVTCTLISYSWAVLFVYV